MYKYRSEFAGVSICRTGNQIRLGYGAMRYDCNALRLRWVAMRCEAQLRARMKRGEISVACVFGELCCAVTVASPPPGSEVHLRLYC